jgi:DNA repair exonuclease SbcCD ATPase subunit
MNMTETREGYVDNLKRKIKDRHAEISRLAGKAIQANADNEIEYRQLMESLVIKRQELEVRIAEMEDAVQSSREELKQQVETLWEALKKKYDNAQSRLEKDLGGDTAFNQHPRRLKDE